MPKFLEKKLKKEYGTKSSIPYAIMNKMGLIHGSKETAKGREMTMRHQRDELKRRTKKVKKS